MTLDLALPLASGALVALSVMLGWLSFRFGEEGATPDRWSEEHELELDLPGLMLRRGSRYRARLSARLLFNLGALCLVASIPLGYANAHVEAGALVCGAISALVLVSAGCYALKSLLDVWRDRREDAFWSFYGGRKLGWMYPNKEAIQRLYFSLNSLPFWSIFQRDWMGALQEPTTEQLLQTNQENDRPSTTIDVPDPGAQ